MENGRQSRGGRIWVRRGWIGGWMGEEYGEGIGRSNEKWRGRRLDERKKRGWGVAQWYSMCLMIFW
jgi:hypothetical protein